MTSGGQCVMTSGVVLMLLWCVGNWDILTLGVSRQFQVKSMLCHAILTCEFCIHRLLSSAFHQPYQTLDMLRASIIMLYTLFLVCTHIPAVSMFAKTLFCAISDLEFTLECTALH